MCQQRNLRRFKSESESPGLTKQKKYCRLYHPLNGHTLLLSYNSHRLFQSLKCLFNNMVAVSTLPRRTSNIYDVPRIRHASEQRLFRRLLSPRGFTSQYPRLIASFACIGVVSTVVLASNILFAVLSHHSQDSPTSSQNLKYLDITGHAPPIMVIAGGAPRTGSTFIYNILRVLMRIRDPNTIASSNWMLAKLVPENNTLTYYDRVALLKTMGTSILVKVHTRKQYYDFVGPAHRNKFADEVDLLVTGYRDLREETVSAYKMFARNRTEYEDRDKWSELCRALIRRRNSLIEEAGDRVPVVDIRYEDWKHGDEKSIMILIRKLGRSLPWEYEEQDFKNTFHEVSRLKTPTGGEVGQRVDWHVTNLMSPRHISHEEVPHHLLEMGIKAVTEERACAQWLREKKYT